MTERIIGIDFGTSTSVIRVKRYDENGAPIGDTGLVLPVTFNMGSTVVPTLIRTNGSDTVYGYEAQIHQKNSTTYQNFKVELESDDEEKKQQARKLTADFFAYLAATYNEQSSGGHLGDSTDKIRTIISYPVKWSDETKQFMIETAKKAGFENVEGMDEAQAAINAVLVQNADHLKKHGYLSEKESVNIMLIDMGAGTTDLVLCKYYIEQKKTDIICTWPKSGEILFGGKEVDDILRDHIKSKLPEEESAGVLKRCGLEKFKSWKENMVSPALKKNDRVEEFSDLDMIVDLLEIETEDYSVDRGVFESISKEYLQKFSKLVAGCIEESKIDATDVDIVILTGGHSQWYFVNEILSGKKREFGEIYLKKIVEDNNRILPIALPQETVALGLVYSNLKQGSVAPAAKTQEKTQPEPESFSQPFSKPNYQIPDEMRVNRVAKLSGSKRIAVMTVVPKNTVVTKGDIVEIYRNNANVSAGIIKGIAKGNINVQKAYTGDEIGLLFESGEQINENDVLVVKKIKLPTKITVSASSYPPEGGYVRGDGSFNQGTTVELVAVPAEGYEFVGWSNGSTYSTLSFKASENVTYTAEFCVKEPEITPAEEFELDSINGCYRIRKYTGNRSHVVIPEEIKGRRVVAIGDSAFGTALNTALVSSRSLVGASMANRSLVSVVIPDTVTIINKSAFAACRKLERVEMSRNLEFLGNNAFSECTSLISIDLGNKLREIPNYAFSECHSLQSVRVPLHVQKIGISAFAGCKNLIEFNFGSGNNEPGVVHFPNTLREIGEEAFMKNSFTGECIFKEIMISRKTVIKKSFLHKKSFVTDPFKNCAVFYYEK